MIQEILAVAKGEVAFICKTQENNEAGLVVFGADAGHDNAGATKFLPMRGKILGHKIEWIFLGKVEPVETSCSIRCVDDEKFFRPF